MIQIRFQDSQVLLHTNPAWTFTVNEITMKVPKCTKYGIHIYNIFRFVSRVLSFPFIICVYKRDGDYKVLSFTIKLL